MIIYKIMIGVCLLEYKKNSDIIKLIFKMKDTEKKIVNTSNNIRELKVLKASMLDYKECLSAYNEGSCYFFECCGFLKSQYFSNDISPSSKNFLIKNLLNPTCKRFLSLSQSLSLLHVDDLHIINLKILKERIEQINFCLFELQREFIGIS